MKISVILGTRPEIVKMAPVIRHLSKTGGNFFILHTGQHYSYEMDKSFFDILELPDPAYNLDAGSGTHAEQTGKILVGIEKILVQEQPDVVLVQGDTNTVLAGALAAAKLHIRIGHVEAGLRSYDRQMPEEINRVIADHISDFLFAPTATARNNLQKEGIPDEKIFTVGNTIVDAVFQNLEIAKKSGDILGSLGLETGRYFLVTAHRAENVDDPERLAHLIAGLRAIAEEYDLPVLFPIHPRTEKNIRQFGIVTDGLTLTSPKNFLEFLQLEAHAKLVLTDSGGVQEETCILGVPCVTLRDNTERPETVDVGANTLAGVEPEQIITATRKMISVSREWKNPFGDGTAAEQIVGILKEKI